jgi:phosphate transport system permease protein
MSSTVAHASDVALSQARRPPLSASLFRAICTAAALAVLGTLTALLLVLLVGAWPAFSTFGAAFIWTAEWDPIEHRYGALAVLAGTFMTSLIAITIAVPIAFGIAVFLTQMAPAWLKRPVGTAIELLAAIPSIIYGMWGLFIFVPWFRDHVQTPVIALTENIPILNVFFAGPAIGLSIAAAGLILALMILPFITAVMRDVFDTVPAILKESAVALGATRFEVVTNVIVPYTGASLVGAILLGLGRALGETMAVTFVIGNSNLLTGSLFSQGNSIASVIALEFAEATDPSHKSALIACGFLLFVLTFIVLASARLLLARMAARAGGVKL